MIRVPDKRYRTVEGGYSCNVCAMCFSKKHTGALTVPQLRKHQCLKKQCDRLAKFDDHAYWEQRKLKKLRAKGEIK